jgi:FOG: GGDEF domain
MSIPSPDFSIGSLCAPFNLDGRELYIGASIGISLYPQHTESPENQVSCADHAMYQVKRKGKNDYAVYAPAPPG